MRERFLGAALLFGLAAGCATTPRPVAKTQLPGCPPAWVSSPDDAYAAAFRSRIGTVWDPEISHRAARYHGEYSDRYTILIADIRPDGGLAAVHVEQRSGIGSFDDAVMAAMRRAEPFPAPPPSLVGSEDFVRIRTRLPTDAEADLIIALGNARPGCPPANDGRGSGRSPAPRPDAEEAARGRRESQRARARVPRTPWPRIGPWQIAAVETRGPSGDTDAASDLGRPGGPVSELSRPKQVGGQNSLAKFANYSWKVVRELR